MYCNVVRRDSVCYDVCGAVLLHIHHNSNTQNAFLPQFVSLLATRPQCCSNIFMQFQYVPLRCASKPGKIIFLLFICHLSGLFPGHFAIVDRPILSPGHELHRFQSVCGTADSALHENT